MNDNKIKLIMEGAETDNGHVDLALFLKELETLRAAINCIEKEIYRSNKSNIKLLVSDLSHSSPAATTLLPVHHTDVNDMTDKVVNAFAQLIEDIIDASIPLETNYKALEILKTLGYQVGSKLKFTTLIIKEKTFDITKSFSRNINNALDRGESCFGSVEGALEQINIHSQEKFFTIYPDIGPQKIRCVFPEHLHQDAVKSIEKRVEVNGLLWFRPGSPYPHQINVDKITVQPDDNELPTFDDLLGIAPFEDERSSEEIIGVLRNGWQ